MFKSGQNRVGGGVDIFKRLFEEARKIKVKKQSPESRESWDKEWAEHVPSGSQQGAPRPQGPPHPGPRALGKLTYIPSLLS